MSKSCRLGIFSHLRRKCFFTLGSAWKMARGMALMETQSVSVKLLMLIFRKSSFSAAIDIGTPFHCIQKSTLAPIAPIWNMIWNFDSKAPCKTLHCALPHVSQCLLQIHLYTFKHVLTLTAMKDNDDRYCCPELQTWVFLAPFCDRWTFWFSGDHVSTAQSCIFDHLVPQELCQSLRRADRSGFLLSIILQFSGHRSVLRNQLKQLCIWHVGSLGNKMKKQGNCI